MARIVDLGVTTYSWVPTIADVTAPTPTELTAGTNITPQVVTTTTVGAAASDTVSERSVADTSNVVTPTVGNYEGTLVLFRDFDAGVPSASDPLTVITPGEVGYLVRRIGKAHDEPFAAGDIVEVYKFIPDNPVLAGGAGDGYLKATYTMHPQGAFTVDAAVTGV